MEDLRRLPLAQKPTNTPKQYQRMLALRTEYMLQKTYNATTEHQTL